MSQSGRFSERAIQLFKQNQLSYTAYRALKTKNNSRPPECKQIPLVESIIFPIVIVLYIMLKFTIKKLPISLRKNQHDKDRDHVFVVGSAKKYKYYSLMCIASELKSSGKSVSLLLSPAARKKQKMFEHMGLETISHRDMHYAVSPTDLAHGTIYSLKTIVKTRKVINDDVTASTYIVAYNLALVEYIKYKSLHNSINKNTSVHTYSPMPYITMCTTNNIFAYQHGITIASEALDGSNERKAYAIPPHVPINYFVWGDIWVDSHTKLAHPNSSVIPTGHPWHENLASSFDNLNEHKYDILFISQPIYKWGEEAEENYEDILEDLIELCDTRNLNLRIKLHPVEERDWYKNHKWDKYIKNFNDLETAIAKSKVVVTDNSSAFIEAALLETPVIVTDSTEMGLDALSPVKNVTFIREISNLNDNIIKEINAASGGTGREIAKIDDTLVSIMGAMESICG